MYTIKFLAPVLLSLCAEEFISGNGDYCAVTTSPPSQVRYYEPGKSCYVNGVFYRECNEK